MSRLPTLSESVVREIAGEALFGRAQADLSAGKFSELTAYRNGVLTAMWDHGRRSATPSLEFHGTELVFDCMCAAFDAHGVCVHTAGLALAWARHPSAFEQLDEDMTLDLLLDDVFGAGLAPAPDRPEAGSLPPPAPPAALSPHTLTLAWPDLTAGYAQELEGLSVAQLRALAQRRGVKLSGAKREPMIETLAAALGNMDALHAAWPSLSPAAKMLAGLAPFVETDFGSSRPHLRQTLQSLNSKLTGQFETALQELQSWGLLFLNHSHDYSGPGPLLFFLPPDSDFVPVLADARGLRQVTAPAPLAFGQLSLRLLLALKADGARYLSRPLTVPHPLAAKAPELRGWPAVPAELEAAAKAPALFQALSQRPLTVPPVAPLLADDDLARLAAAIGVSAEQADFALRLLVKLGLVHWAPGEPATVREDGFVQYLAQPPLQYVPPLFNAFAVLNDWSELNLALTNTPGLALKRQVRYGITFQALLGSLQTARFHLLQLLRRAVPGQWTDVDALVQRARQLNLLQAFWPLPPGVFLEQEGRSLAADSAEHWRAFYRPFVEALLAGPLHWQGLVDLGYRQDRLAGVRLTELGALTLYQRTTYTPPAQAADSGPALQFGADGRLIVAPSAAHPQLLSTLSLLGEAHATAAGQLSYAVTPAGAARAFQAGWEPDALLEVLDTAAGQPVPAPLAGALRQWWAHFGDVHVYSDVAVMELADDYALAELLASTSLAQYLLYRFSPRVIALRPEGVEPLRAELVSRGYTPKVAGAG